MRSARAGGIQGRWRRCQPGVMAIACPDSATGLLHNRPMPVRPLPRLSLRAALAAGLMSLATVALAQAVAEDPAAAAAANPAAPADHHAYATGDAWIDGRLADIDAYAARYPDAFADELERHAGIPQAYTLALLARPGWQGGDAWFACFLGRAVQASCRSVVRERSRAGPDATWTAVAGGFDARPGSPAYASLRLALADSYRRWDRPLQPDAALKRALREREQRQAEAVR